MKKIIFFVACFYLLSCSKENDPITEIAHAEIVITDTLYIEHTGLSAPNDYNPATGRILMHDFYSKEVFQTDLKGRKLASFNRAGQGPENFGNMLMGLSYLHGDTVLVYSERGFFVYGPNGEPLGMTPVPKGTASYTHSQRVEQVDWNGQTFWLAARNRGDMVRPVNIPPRPNETKFGLQPATADTAWTPFISYEEGSVYLDKENYYLASLSSFAWDNTTRRLYVTYELDPSIYVYSLEQKGFRLVRTFPMQAEKMKPLTGIPYGQPLPGNTIEMLMKNGTFFSPHHLPAQQAILLPYKPGVPDDLIKEALSNMHTTPPANPAYLMGYHAETGRKLWHDIPIPSPARMLALAISTEQLLFYVDKEKLEYEPNSDMFLMGKVVRSAD